MKHTPTVSVILPTYNRAATLARSIESVLNQTFDDLELLIIDDGSTDATETLLNSYIRDRRVRVFRNSHIGCAAARNFGLAKASGRYIAFQDSDDEWLGHKLSVAVNKLESSSSEIGVFYSPMIEVRENGEHLNHLPPTQITLGKLIDEETLDYQVWRIGIQSAVVRRECFDEVGEFDENLGRYIDLDLFIRLAFRYHFICNEEALVKYYQTPASISRNQSARIFCPAVTFRKNINRSFVTIAFI